VVLRRDEALETAGAQVDNVEKVKRWGKGALSSMGQRLAASVGGGMDDDAEEEDAAAAAAAAAKAAMGKAGRSRGKFMRKR
jgi:hypothetical protein